MAEWSNAAVLKTVDLHGSGGSNPSLSANEKEKDAKVYFQASFSFSFASPAARWRGMSERSDEIPGEDSIKLTATQTNPEFYLRGGTKIND